MRVTGNYGTFTEEIWMETKERYQIEPITNKVQEIIQSPGELSARVIVKPFAQFGKIREVLMVWPNEYRNTD